MKVLISFKAAKGYDHFKGARLRKTLKGACELNGISWVDSLYSNPEIIHLVSPDDENKIGQNDLIGRKLVISCGYCEGDPKASYFETGPSGLVLKNKDIHFLNKADLILVPNKKTEDILRSFLVTPPIKVVEAGVNLSRFESLSLGEKIAFYRYYRISETDPFILSVADYQLPENLDLIIKIANNNPKLKYFVFSNKSIGGGYKKPSRSIRKKVPSNLIISSLAEDDVYRSAMSNALAYVRLNNRCSESMQILEAYASKTQVIYLKQNDFDQELLKKGAIFCPDPKLMPSIISSISLKPHNESIISAYSYARENSLPNFAAKMKRIYEELLNEREG